MGWAVPMEVTPAVGPHGAGCSCGRCGMRGRFWSRAGVRRGHRREGQNPGPPRVWLGTGSCCRQPSCGSTFICEPVWGGLSQRIWGCSAMGSLHWGEPLALPVGQAPPGGLNAWDQGNGTKQGLDPNGAIPPAQGAAANPKPHLWHTTPVPQLWSHPGVSSHWGPIPAPSLGTGRAQQRQIPAPSCPSRTTVARARGWRHAGHSLCASTRAGQVPMSHPAQAPKGPPSTPGTPQHSREPPAPQGPPSTLSKHPGAQQDEPWCHRTRAALGVFGVPQLPQKSAAFQACAAPV